MITDESLTVYVDMVERIKRRIMECCADDDVYTSADTLAAMVFHSKWHLSRIFRMMTGMSMAHYRKAVRLELAHVYFTMTGFSILDVANIVGYSSYGTFSSSYSQHIGHPPSYYQGGRNCDPDQARAEVWNYYFRDHPYTRPYLYDVVTVS
jgi:transcriptional regulator GlxA family with amidase domain